MLSLNDREWCVFDFNKIFDIQKGFYNKKPLCIDTGLIPFVGASDSNNGFTGFTSYEIIKASSKIGYGKNEPIDKKIFKGKAICVTNNGSVGYAYYQQHSFTCTHDVNPLYLLDRELNRHLATFLICCIEQQRVCFAYARKWRPKRMEKSKLRLPISETGNPDWAFMEAYMKQKEQEILKPTIDKLCKRLIDSVLTGGGNSLLGKQWKEFYFTNVFTEIQRGKRLKKADHLQGNIPYVSSTAINNGVDGFIGNDNHTRVFSNCLSLANSGSVGSSFFHQYEFVASDHITQLKREGLDKYAYLFMIPIVSRLSEKYSFNREINDNRIKREKILLPVNESDEIDFAFMSSFMKSIEKDILGTTLKYFGNRLNNSELGGGNLKWSVFYLDEIFNIFAGKRLTKANMQVGNRPFIGATDNNNGITEWVNNTNNSLDSNVLGVNYNGSVGETFYHPYECIFSDDVKRLHLKDSVNSRYVMLYLKTIIVQQKVKYAYGYKFNEKRMQRQKLVLPVDKNGKPNWDYMEKFMRNLESQAIITYLEQYKQRISNQ